MLANISCDTGFAVPLFVTLRNLGRIFSSTIGGALLFPDSICNKFCRISLGCSFIIAGTEISTLSGITPESSGLLVLCDTLYSSRIFKGLPEVNVDSFQIIHSIKHSLELTSITIKSRSGGEMLQTFAEFGLNLIAAMSRAS
jgi:hypothetical protein